MTTRDEVVYFAYSGGRIKIGYTTNILKRWSDLECGSPFPVNLLFTLQGGKELEKRIHARFVASRVSGEWFAPTEDLIEFIEKMDDLRKPEALPAAPMVRRLLEMEVNEFN